jgi:hypothetical protein
MYPGGNFLGAAFPMMTAGQGIQTPYGPVMLPVGSQVAAYVRSTGRQDGDSPDIDSKRVTNIQDAFTYCRAGMGDSIVVLPGHSESTTSATYLSALRAGTRIIGMGHGSNRATLRLTAAGAQLAIAVADVVISGMRLRLEGANGVTKAIVSTAADTTIHGCDIEVASGAALKATIAVEIGAAAHRFSFLSNIVRGTATHNMTNCVLNAGVADGIRIIGNEMIASATAGNGLINIQAASLGLKILYNQIVNTHTASTSGITLGAAASSGIIAHNNIGILAASTTTDGTAGIIIGATSICNLFDNRVSDGLNNGSLCPATAS